MIGRILIVLSVMVLAYILGQWRRFSVELSLFLAAFSGAIAGAFFSTPPWTQILRHLAEGSFTYLDVILVFSTATIFMAILRESGGIDYVVRFSMKSLGKIRPLALLVLMIIVLIPGALTGAGSVSLLVVGAPVAVALNYLGISRPRTAAILFILAGWKREGPKIMFKIIMISYYLISAFIAAMVFWNFWLEKKKVDRMILYLLVLVPLILRLLRIK